MMDWKALEERFERMHWEGDCDAEWRFDPESLARQQWQLAGDRGFAAIFVFNEELSRAGRMLRREIGKKSLVPKKLVAGDVLMAEAWLNALRHLRINVFENQPEMNCRRDEGRIRDVAHASAQLCIRMRAMTERNIEIHARRVLADARGSTATDKSGVTATAA